ncbi:hypothetical protein H0H93_005855 [Arthromyces matolae]|nr:hypothetical protein H0H93_005855 [Arthromyces matolae]
MNLRVILWLLPIFMLSALTASATPIDRSATTNGSPPAFTTSHIPSARNQNLRHTSPQLLREALKKVEDVAEDAVNKINAIKAESSTLVERLAYSDYNSYLEHLEMVSEKAQILLRTSQSYEAASDGSDTSPHVPPSSPRSHAAH